MPCGRRAGRCDQWWSVVIPSSDGSPIAWRIAIEVAYPSHPGNHWGTAAAVTYAWRWPGLNAATLDLPTNADIVNV